MTINLAAPLQKDSIVDGEGLRMVIWTQGCTHNCKGCHNPHTHSFNGGVITDIEVLKKEILEASKTNVGVTFSGGDPIFQAKEVLELAKYIKSLDLNIWLYTGFTFEQLLDATSFKPEIKELLTYLDVIIDGRFVLEQKNLNLKFRGSSNQRLIDVKESLSKGNVVEITKYDEVNTLKPIYEKPEYLFV